MSQALVTEVLLATLSPDNEKRQAAEAAITELQSQAGRFSFLSAPLNCDP